MAKKIKEDDGRLSLKLDMSDPQQKMVKEFLNLLVRKKSEYISALVFAHLKEVGISDVSLLTKAQAKEVMHDAIMKSISQNGITRFIATNEQGGMPAYPFPTFPVRGGLNKEVNFQQPLSKAQDEASKPKNDVQKQEENKEHEVHDLEEVEVEKIPEVPLSNLEDETEISDEALLFMDEWN